MMLYYYNIKDDKDSTVTATVTTKAATAMTKVATAMTKAATAMTKTEAQMTRIATAKATTTMTATAI